MNNTLNKTIREKSEVFKEPLPTYNQMFLGYSIGFFFSSSAVVANLILLVLILKKKQQRNPFDLVIASLSFTDFSASICSISYIAYQITIFFIASSELEKHNHQSYMALTAFVFLFYVSLMHVFLVTFLRCFALFWPLKFRQFVTKAIIKALIVWTWTLSVIGGVTIIMSKDKGLVTGIIFFSSGGLVCCAYAIIATKICILSKTSQSPTYKEHRVLLNSFGVAITFFGCMLPLAGALTGVEIFQSMDGYLVLSFITTNFLADPLLYFYFSYWLSKRDEMRRIKSNSLPVQGRDEVQNRETHVRHY